MPDPKDKYLEADELASKVRDKGEDVAFQELDAALTKFRDAGHSVEALVPTGVDGPGFALGHTRDGRSFWKIYAEILRDKLCSKDQEFARLATAGLSGSACAIASAIMTTFALPPAAAAVVIPMAAIIAVTGIDAFCRYTDPRAEGAKKPEKKAPPKKKSKG